MTRRWQAIARRVVSQKAHRLCFALHFIIVSIRAMQRCWLCMALSAALSLGWTPPAHRYAATRRKAALRARQPPAEEQTADRRAWLGALLPVGVGLAAQAPLIALIARPPDESARDKTLSSWCNSDYCTLLGGGAGHAVRAATRLEFLGKRRGAAVSKLDETTASPPILLKIGQDHLSASARRFSRK